MIERISCIYFVSILQTISHYKWQGKYIYLSMRLRIQVVVEIWPSDWTVVTLISKLLLIMLFRNISTLEYILSRINISVESYCQGSNEKDLRPLQNLEHSGRKRKKVPVAPAIPMSKVWNLNNFMTIPSFELLFAAIIIRMTRGDYLHP